jgi:hypothetical protein
MGISWWTGGVPEITKLDPTTAMGLKLLAGCQRYPDANGTKKL